ncbi:PREDICTED: uncharacterized protein LOC105569231 isoform X2 [Vollenhovia emeryi]|nr:PREDICTED: uncharacterized protein LOC105569231 isoform X2 [Vollenhovia emeryi]
MEIQSDDNIPMRWRLSAQLMGGVTKIYSLQVNNCLKEAFQIHPMCEDEDYFRAIEEHTDRPPADPVIEMPHSGPNILNAPLEEDLYLLSDMSDMSDKSDERLNIALSFEDVTMTEPPGPVEDVTVPASKSPVLSLKQTKTRKLVTEEKIVLSDKLLKPQNIHCKPLATSTVPQLLPTTTLTIDLTQPSHSRWNARLCKRFCIAGPFTNVTEDVAPDCCTEPWQLAEAMRVPEEPMNRPNLHTVVNTFKKIDIAIAEPTDSTTRRSRTEKYSSLEKKSCSKATYLIKQTVSAAEQVLRFAKDLERLYINEEKDIPKRTSNVSITEEIEKEHSSRETQVEIPTKRRVPVPALDNTGGSSQPDLTSQGLYALLQVLWRDNEMVRFSDLISPERYTKSDAATAFGMLLGKCCYICNVFRCFKK